MSYFLGPPATRRRGPGGRSLLFLLALILVGGLVASGVVLAMVLGSDDKDTHGAATHSFTVDSKFVKRKLHEEVAVPPGGGSGRPLLVLLHGRNGKPEDMFTSTFFDELKRLGSDAPIVVAVDGGASSYYHDRKDGDWGRYVVREAIPQAVERYSADPKRVAIGGTSMGGFGALDLARLHPRSFCAVGGHSAALWRRAGDTPAGAFDDARDFARHDVYAGAAKFKGQHVWLDVGKDDPFRPVDTAFARSLRKRGADVTFHLWPGGHGQAYYSANAASYLRYYAAQLKRC